MSRRNTAARLGVKNFAKLRLRDDNSLCTGAIVHSWPAIPLTVAFGEALRDTREAARRLIYLSLQEGLLRMAVHGGNRILFALCGAILLAGLLCPEWVAPMRHAFINSTFFFRRARLAYHRSVGQLVIPGDSQSVPRETLLDFR